MNFPNIMLFILANKIKNTTFKIDFAIKNKNMGQLEKEIWVNLIDENWSIC